MPTDDTDRLMWAAARGLQLHYDTPHQMICLDSCRRLERTCGQEAAGAARAYLADYVEAQPQLVRGTPGLSAEGPPDVPDDVEGMAISLAEGKVFNAVFYALRLAEAGGTEALCRTALQAASREVDGLGHVFIYTDSALRLAESCDAETRAEVLLPLMEYLARKALHAEPDLLKETSGLPALIKRAAERVGLLGHNVIYARSLVLREGDLEAGRFEHARAQLARNIADAEDEFTPDRMQQVTPLVPDGVPQVSLPELTAAGHEEAAMGAVRGYVAEGADVQDIVDGLVLAFCRIDVRQPHYLILPESVQLLSECMAPLHRELAFVQLARMAAGAARQYGTRVPPEQGGR